MRLTLLQSLALLQGAEAFAPDARELLRDTNEYKLLDNLKLPPPTEFCINVNDADTLGIPYVVEAECKS